MSYARIPGLLSGGNVGPPVSTSIGPGGVVQDNYAPEPEQYAYQAANGSIQYASTASQAQSAAMAVMQSNANPPNSAPTDGPPQATTSTAPPSPLSSVAGSLGISPTMLLIAAAGAGILVLFLVVRKRKK
jgi:hypothetical protein